MYFLQAFSPKLSVVIGNVWVEIPRFTIKDFSEWAEELRQRMISDATAHLDDEKKSEYLAFYPISPPTRQQLRVEAATDTGMERIVRVCLGRADYFDVKVVKKTKKDKDSKPIMVKDQSGNLVKDTYDEPSKGDPIQNPGQEWTDQLVLNNTGRLAHLAIELADMNDTSMVVPARVAIREQKEQEKEEGDQDPLPEEKKGGETP